MRHKDFREIPRKTFAAYRATVVRFFLPQQPMRITALPKPALYASKEVLAVIKINPTFSQQAGFALPVSGIAPAAATRALPVMGGVSVVAAGSKRRFEDVASVCGYTHIADTSVLTGTFPGTSAWSPPI
jgi:hypothetical protein